MGFNDALRAFDDHHAGGVAAVWSSTYWVRVEVLSDDPAKQRKIERCAVLWSNDGEFLHVVQIEAFATERPTSLLLARPKLLRLTPRAMLFEALWIDSATEFVWVLCMEPRVREV